MLVNLVRILIMCVFARGLLSDVTNGIKEKVVALVPLGFCKNEKEYRYGIIGYKLKYNTNKIIWQCMH